METTRRLKPRSLESAYFEWLYSIVADQRRGYRSYIELCTILHTTLFEWSIPNDENRAADGVALREDFLRDYNLENIDGYRLDSFLRKKCSIFEMMVALSMRVESILATEGDNTFRWFSDMLRNLGFYEYTDGMFKELTNNERERLRSSIVRSLETMVSRRYGRDGKGSLYPSIKEPTQNIAETEIWYQMHLFYASRQV